MSTTTAQREYKLAADPIIRKGIEPMRQIVELTDGGAHLVVAVVPNAYAMDVLEAIRRAYTDGREDRDDGPDPLDGRLLGMARILRETGNGNAADEIEIAAAYVREALRGSDDGGIADNLETVAAYVRELAKAVRDYPAAAREAEIAGGEKPDA